jgi:putative membrane protein
LICVIGWILGDLYAPKLLAYYAQPDTTTDQRAMLASLTKRLVLFVSTPTMVIAVLTGIYMIATNMALLKSGGWMHAKLTFGVILIGFHMMLLNEAKTIATTPQTAPAHSAKYYKMLSRVPEISLLIIIIMVIVRPF